MCYFRVWWKAVDNQELQLVNKLSSGNALTVFLTCLCLSGFYSTFKIILFEVFDRVHETPLTFAKIIIFMLPNEYFIKAGSYFFAVYSICKWNKVCFDK